ncbi:MAG: ATP-dependent sacrificial sulfur transferase LarE [Desulfobacterales bacterium]
MKRLHQKKEQLVSGINRFESLMVAYSGGVDSSLLLSVAHELLKSRVVAITSSSRVHPQDEIEAAAQIAGEMGVRHIVVETDEMSMPEFTANPNNRCYICKKHLFETFRKKASELGIADISHGANVDDLQDNRPGFKAAKELGVHAPLLDAGFTKEDIRRLAKERGLPNWEKPAMACLATRIPYGTAITENRLRMIGSAEDFLREKGFSGCRVRHHGDIARIEVCQQDFQKILDPEMRVHVSRELKEIGYLRIVLDLEGYIPGSMNRKL